VFISNGQCHVSQYGALTQIRMSSKLLYEQLDGLYLMQVALQHCD